MTKPLRPLDLARLDALLVDREDAVTGFMRITEAMDLMAADGYSEDGWDRFITALTEVLGPEEARSMVWAMVREA
jgi:hypothetical protein